MALRCVCCVCSCAQVLFALIVCVVVMACVRCNKRSEIRASVLERLVQEPVTAPDFIGMPCHFKAVPQCCLWICQQRYQIIRPEIWGKT